MSFFIDYKDRFVLEPTDNHGLRQCQLGAIWALKSHFTTTSNEIASLISMPTGSGKTALMMATCFSLQISKVLIIVPSKILRRQMCEQFRSLKVLKDNGCLPNDLPEVRVFEVEERQSSMRSWVEILNTHDVVVAHPNSISPYYANLYPLPAELIDAVFIDEGHHEPAPTWKALNEYYLSTKRVFFTATPFRRDRKRMRAKLIYHYPIGKAIDDGIMRPVNFRGEQAGLYDDTALIKTAFEVFSAEKKINPSASIIIRTDRIDDANTLVKKYNESNINVDVIHSKRSSNVNSNIVQKVKDGELDGIVCVGIASEGLDIPNLKIAVLHATPRSIPYTIQFLGRISRQPIGQEGSAILIANSDEVRGEVSRLYNSDNAWSRLIPEIVDEHMRRVRHYRSNYACESDFLMPELNIFFSALVYETTVDFCFKENFETKSGSPFEILHVEQQDDDSPLIIITKYDKPIDWASRSLYIEDLLDVHIFYHISDRNLLFELTTSELALDSFKKDLLTTEVSRIPYGKLYRILSEFNQSDYIMVGMKNAVMQGASQPSYKTVIGSGVQATIRASEGRVFSAGHALLRIDEDNTWGIATKKGRVWAMKRGTAEEFGNWCDNLSRLIQNGPIISSLPGLSFLANTSPINNINQIPIAIIPDDLFFRAYSLIIDIIGKERFSNIIPTIQPLSINQETRDLNCSLRIGSYQYELTMNFNADNLWSLLTKDNIMIRAYKNEDNIIEESFEEILNNFPPSLVMPDGCIIEGRNKITPNNRIERLPRDIWHEKDWTDCKITAERYAEQPEIHELPVINKTIELIRPMFNIGNDVIILDDGSHEIADLIWLQGLNRRIHFIHCKPSGYIRAGCRKGDCDVLFAQAMRSIHWVSSSLLIDRIQERLNRNSCIVLGSSDIFENLRNNYQINDWSYNIVLSQPGFKISQVSDPDRNNNNVYELTIPMYERILGGLASLEIWGT